MTTTSEQGVNDNHSAAGGTHLEGDFSRLGFSARRMMDALAVPCFFMDKRSVFLAGNETFYQMIGAGSEPYVGRDVYASLIPGQSAMLREADLLLLQQGGSSSQEAEIVTAAREARSVVLKKSIFCDESGRQLGILVALLDLSELADVKNALSVSESEKQAILDCFPGIVSLFDTNERVIWANDKVRELHQNPVGRTCHEIFCQKEKSCNSCAVPKSLASGRVQSTIQQFEMWTSAGEERIYELTSTPLLDSSGKVRSAVVIGRDVTETTMLEKQLRHTQKMEAIGTLAGGIAHDFNNVLTPIMGYSEILRYKLMQNGERDATTLEFIEGILKAGKRAKNLVEQILTFPAAASRRRVCSTSTRSSRR